MTALQQDLSIGLHTVTEINQSIRYADTKAGALAAVQALAVTVLANRRAAGTADLVPMVVFTVGLGLVLASAGLLVAGQVPRLSRPTAAGSRIAFPALATMSALDVLTTPSPAGQHEQVWRQASDLASIAMAKYRWLHRATVATFLTLATVLLWLGVTAWFTP
ncbi:Pycsar system effector family protein [Actinoplanes sp. NPDC048967]|uniref:Pycsar system effector family protein n=1 Tax=Actinoplanes sp. NPDC048967 TaxID=3155269 RepID=UPI0033F0E189